jgi:hypothetical protein
MELLDKQHRQTENKCARGKWHNFVDYSVHRLLP